MDEVEDWVLHLVGSPWTYPVVAGILAVGAIITFLPTQSLVVAVGALLMARHEPLSLLSLAGATFVGMVVGDLAVYGLARGARRARKGRPPRSGSPHGLGRVVARIERRVGALRGRFRRAPFRTLAIGRFIPTGRTATDLLGGEGTLTTRRFLRYSATAAVAYAAFFVGFAALAGPFADRYPLLVTVLVVVLSIGAGLLIGWIDSRLQARRAAQEA
jgi:membrane-associated protein